MLHAFDVAPEDAIRGDLAFSADGRLLATGVSRYSRVDKPAKYPIRIWAILGRPWPPRHTPARAGEGPGSKIGAPP